LPKAFPIALAQGRLGPQGFGLFLGMDEHRGIFYDNRLESYGPSKGVYGSPNQVNLAYGQQGVAVATHDLDAVYPEAVPT
jgi:hypothetical protein